MFIVPQGTTPDWKLEYVFDRAAGMRVAKRSAIEKDFFCSLFRCPMKVLLMPGQAAGPGSIFPKPLPCKFFSKKADTPHGRPRWSTTWSRTRIQVSFWEREKQS